MYNQSRQSMKAKEIRRPDVQTIPVRYAPSDALSPTRGEPGRRGNPGAHHKGASAP